MRFHVQGVYRYTETIRNTRNIDEIVEANSEDDAIVITIESCVFFDGDVETESLDDVYAETLEEEEEEEEEPSAATEMQRHGCPGLFDGIE